VLDLETHEPGPEKKYLQLAGEETVDHLLYDSPSPESEDAGTAVHHTCGG
jgi:hypothetical protein